ncbi:MAG: aldolase [Methanomassiliicoccus sp.]|nr:aldolase [Methanomassiliicoccus sp.]
MSELDKLVPLDVPRAERRAFQDNYAALTSGKGRLMLFAGDQKVEHLNTDFLGDGISPDDGDPEHLFRIASRARIGAFATQFGLVSRYGMSYPDVPYVIKLNSKTNLVKIDQAEPLSVQWQSVDDVVKLREESGLRILGIGYTFYIGSEHEAHMLREAAQIVNQAHRHGLPVILWSYARGKAVPEEKDARIIAGAAGVAACLGADFAKVNYPQGADAPARLGDAVRAAGRTKIICSGGGRIEVEPFLQRLHAQINVSGTSGSATGRNIHQKSLGEAVRFANAIYAITVEGASTAEAMSIYWGDLEK